eukprot:g1348.t1
MSSQQNHALRADNHINSPYKRAAHSGTFGGVPGDKENAGSEARAAAEGKLAQEIAHHLKAAAPSPGACGKQQQQQQQQQQQHGQPKTPSGLTPTMRSMFFAAAAAASTTPPAAAAAADVVSSPKAVIGGGGPMLPLSPSSTAKTNFGSREGISPYSRTARVTGFAQAHAGAVLRVPASRTSKPAASRREAKERRDCAVDADEALPSPTSEMKTPEKAAPSDYAPAKPEVASVPGGMPKRSRSPVAELTLPPPARCDDEVSRELEAKARRRSPAHSHSHSSIAARAAASGAGLFSASTGSGSVFDSGGCDGRWRKLHARGGGADGPPRLKLSVEAAGDNDEVLMSPSGLQGDDHDPPTRRYCSSPVSLSSSRLGSGGRRGGRDRDNVLASSVDSDWSMGSIDETAARELDNTREEDKTSGSDPVARVLLGQSDDCGLNSAATASPTTEGTSGAVPPAGGDNRSGPPSTPAVVGVADAGADADVGVSSPHAFEVAGGDKGGGGAAASLLRSTAVGSIVDAPPRTAGLFSLGSRSAGLGDAGALPRTRLFKPVAFRLP